jgi:hypothetical protein
VGVSHAWIGVVDACRKLSIQLVTVRSVLSAFIHPTVKILVVLDPVVNLPCVVVRP